MVNLIWRDWSMSIAILEETINLIKIQGHFSVDGI